MEIFIFWLQIQAEKKKLLHSLGNLLLLSRSKNSELQNKSFSYKKKHTNKDGNETGYFNGSYSEIDVTRYENWTPIEIFNRGKELIAFLTERWDIDFNGWEIASEEDLLQLEFMQKPKIKTIYERASNLEF